MTVPLPVVFIHGLWLHSSSWQPWIGLFREKGYAASAPRWPDDPDTVEAARRDPESVAGRGIDDVVDHYAALIEDLPVRPVVIGHSFGGTIAQKPLGQDRAAAAVAIDAAQIKGVLPLPLSALKATFPVFRNPANRRRSVSLTAKQFRFAFGNAVTEEESAALHARWTVPAPGKPLFEAASAIFSLHSPAKVDTMNSGRGPLLLVSGGKDHTVPQVVTRATLKQYRHSEAVTDFIDFPDRGHSLTIDGGWREVADTVLTWLRQRSPETGR
ncbi:alpha/beta hydrolase [Streptomyces rishiriensis]|uniref:alpha/beta hydrolase n=1 Tax=Streptomyces rishiriensis TaxID=68264 RepID=UPI0037BA438B